MFCALLGQDIRRAFTGPLVLWFIIGVAERLHLSSLGFGADQIRTLVSMATDFIHAGKDVIHKSLNEFETWPIRPRTAELAALNCLKKFQYT